MAFISIKEYALKNKISIFNAMKLANSGKVETVKKVINGKEQIFIKDDAKISIVKEPKDEESIKELISEIEKLKQRVEELEKKLEYK